MSSKENLERKVELVPKPEPDFTEGEVIELGQKSKDIETSSKIKRLEETAQFESLGIQAQARDILGKNITSFTQNLASAEPKEFASMMKTLSDIAGITKNKSDISVQVPIQVILDI